MNNIKPIETAYNGYRFRSRLEARWAVFFETLGIEYQYEPEGLNINGIYYLPDFYLPKCNQFFEVKGVMADTDMEKISALISAGYSVTIGYADGKFVACDNWSYPESPEYTLNELDGSWLCQCNSCGNYWFMGNTGSYICPCCGEYDGDHHFSIEMYGDGDHGTAKLWDSARKARFEHEERSK